MGASDQFMNQHLFVKIRDAGPHQLIVAHFTKTQGIRFAHGASFSRAIGCNWRLDLDGPALRHFNFTSE